MGVTPRQTSRRSKSQRRNSCVPGYPAQIPLTVNGHTAMSNVGLYKSGLRLGKPWGTEVLIACVPGLELWELHMEPGSSTSLHQHNNKHTGLICLSGGGSLVLDSRTLPLRPTDSHFIAAATPHRIVAPNSMVVWELESPPNKEDIERLEDRHGRVGKPFLFGSSVLSPRAGDAAEATHAKGPVEALLALFAGDGIWQASSATLDETANDITTQATRWSTAHF